MKRPGVVEFRCNRRLSPLWLNNARVPFGVEETVYRYICQGKLVASKLGRQYRILKENVQLFLLGTSTAGEA